MTRTYKPRRFSDRWNTGAPEYILDCFDNPQFADRYTVLFGGSMTGGDGTYRNTWIHGLGTSESGHVSGMFELSAHQQSAYRYANKHRRIAWSALPESVQQMAIRIATETE